MSCTDCMEENMIAKVINHEASSVMKRFYPAKDFRVTVQLIISFYYCSYVQYVILWFILYDIKKLKRSFHSSKSVIIRIRDGMIHFNFSNINLLAYSIRWYYWIPPRCFSMRISYGNASYFTSIRIFLIFPTIEISVKEEI